MRTFYMMHRAMAFAVTAFYMPFVWAGQDTAYQEFLSDLSAGVECQRLFELRNEATGATRTDELETAFGGLFQQFLKARGRDAAEYGRLYR